MRLNTRHAWPLSDDLVMGLRLLCRLPTYLRNPLTIAESRAILRRRLERREEDFLDLVRRACGTVVSIIEVKNEEEAVAVANETMYGLTAAVFTSDFAKGLGIAERIESGIVHLNDQTVHDEPQVPFGGIKDSGWGRLGGRAALEEFTELRWISMQRTSRHYPF